MKKLKSTVLVSACFRLGCELFFIEAYVSNKVEYTGTDVLNFLCDLGALIFT